MKINPNNAAMIYGATLHVASIAAVATLIGVGAVPANDGLPILGGLVGIGVGAGAALVVPGVPGVPSAGPVQLSTVGSAAPAPPHPLAPQAPVQLVSEAPQAPQMATSGPAAPQ